MWPFLRSCDVHPLLSSRYWKCLSLCSPGENSYSVKQLIAPTSKQLHPHSRCKFATWDFTAHGYQRADLNSHLKLESIGEGITLWPVDVGPGLVLIALQIQNIENFLFVWIIIICNHIISFEYSLQCKLFVYVNVICPVHYIA